MDVYCDIEIKQRALNKFCSLAHICIAVPILVYFDIVKLRVMVERYGYASLERNKVQKS